MHALSRTTGGLRLTKLPGCDRNSQDDTSALYHACRISQPPASNIQYSFRLFGCSKNRNQSAVSLSFARQTSLLMFAMATYVGVPSPWLLFHQHHPHWFTLPAKQLHFHNLHVPAFQNWYMRICRLKTGDDRLMKYKNWLIRKSKEKRALFQENLSYFIFLKQDIMTRFRKFFFLFEWGCTWSFSVKRVWGRKSVRNT